MNVILRWVCTGYYQVYYMGSRQIFHYLCLICFFSSLHAVKQIVMSWSLSVCGCVAAGRDGSAAVSKWPWADSWSWLPATICYLLAQTQAALKNNEESLRFMELFIIKLKLNIHAEIFFLIWQQTQRNLLHKNQSIWPLHWYIYSCKSVAGFPITYFLGYHIKKCWMEPSRCKKSA